MENKSLSDKVELSGKIPLFEGLAVFAKKGINIDYQIKSIIDYIPTGSRIKASSIKSILVLFPINPEIIANSRFKCYIDYSNEYSALVIEILKEDMPENARNLIACLSDSLSKNGGFKYTMPLNEDSDKGTPGKIVKGFPYR